MWIITEYYPMGDLSSVLNRVPFLSWEQTLSLVLCIVKGVNFLHYEDKHGKPSIAHRDIKPSNILVSVLVRVVSYFAQGLQEFSPLCRSGKATIGVHSATLVWRSLCLWNHVTW